MQKINSKQTVYVVRTREDGKVITVITRATRAEAIATANLAEKESGQKFWYTTPKIDHSKANTPKTVFAAHAYLQSRGIESAADYYNASAKNPWILQILNQGIAFHLLPDAPQVFKDHAAAFFRDSLVKSVKSATDVYGALGAAKEINALHNNALAKIANERKFGSLGAGVVSGF